VNYQEWRCGLKGWTGLVNRRVSRLYLEFYLLFSDFMASFLNMWSTARRSIEKNSGRPIGLYESILSLLDSRLRDTKPESESRGQVTILFLYYGMRDSYVVVSSPEVGLLGSIPAAL